MSDPLDAVKDLGGHVTPIGDHFRVDLKERWKAKDMAILGIAVRNRSLPTPVVSNGREPQNVE